MKKKVTLIVFFIIGGVYFYSKNSSKIQNEVSDDITKQTKTNWKAQKVIPTPAIEKIVKAKALVKPNQEKAIIPPFKPANQNEESLKTLSVTFKEAFDDKEDSKSFRDKLKKLNLTPSLNVNTNPYTGSMSIIRTKDNLPGTRYIHAQYVTGSNGNEGLQHLSFEYRPGPNALQRASEAVKSIFGIEGKPVQSKGDFVSYKLTEDYIIWLKRMGEDDLKDDPFNAYTKNDVGTIRVAIELEIHGDENDSHVFPDGN